MLPCQIGLHVCVGALVLTEVAILTTGYVLTCRHLKLWGEATNLQLEKDIITRHHMFDASISCRSLMTDPSIHFELKHNNPAMDYRLWSIPSYTDNMAFTNMAFTENLRIGDWPTRCRKLGPRPPLFVP